jgi:hypothetical protein
MKKLIFFLAIVLTYNFTHSQTVVASKTGGTTIIQKVKPDSVKKDSGKLQKALTVLNDTDFNQIPTPPESGTFDWLVWISATGLFLLNIIVRIAPTVQSLKIFQIFTQIFKLISKVTGWLAKVIPDKKKGGGTHENSTK